MVAGLKAPPRDYSLLGDNTGKAFNAIGALATIAFAFNTGILPEMQVRIVRYMLDSEYKNYQRLKKDGETLMVINFEPARLTLLLRILTCIRFGNDLVMQATIRRPATTNIYKALWLQFTIGTIPFVVLTFVGYWAYGNAVYPYILINLSGPKPLIIATNITAFLQALVALHVSGTAQALR